MTDPLPPGWVLTEVGKICKVEYGKGLSKKQRVETGEVEVFGSAGFSGYHDTSLVDEPIVIVGRKGNAGRVWVTQGPSWPIDTTYFLRPPHAISPKYLSLQLGHLDLVKKDSSTTIPSLRRPDLEATQINLAPLVEQQRIVAAVEEHFSRIDAAESAAQTALARLDTLRRAILTAAFSGHLVEPLNPRRTTDGLPKNWHWSRLGDISQKPQYGWTTKSNYGTGINYLRTTDISRGEIDWNSVPVCINIPDDLNKFILHHGDIVVSRAGSVGISCMIKNPPTAVFASYLIRLRITDAICASYVAYFLKSAIYWTAISDAKVGIAVQNVNAKKLAAIRIPLAPPNEQEQIVAAIEEHLSRIDSAKTTLERCLQRCNILRRSILAAAFLGRLVEQDPSDEPASVLLERIAAEQPKRRTRRKSA